MSAPFCNKRITSSLSPAAHAAKYTQSAENLILRSICLGCGGSRFVSDVSQRFNCSALLKRAELDRVSRDIIWSTLDSHSLARSLHLLAACCPHTISVHCRWRERSPVDEPRELLDSCLGYSWNARDRSVASERSDSERLHCATQRASLKTRNNLTPILRSATERPAAHTCSSSRGDAIIGYPLPHGTPTLPSVCAKTTRLLVGGY